jgi:hypothetical protein
MGIRPDPPSCRATIRGRQITLNPWRPGLLHAGPESGGLHTVDAALADLRLLQHEVIVAPVPRIRWTRSAEAAILQWALAVGYGRMWLPRRVVVFDGAPTHLATAMVHCPTCGATWSDGSVDFWHGVREAGLFPGTCLACGGSLPEWTAAPASRSRAPRKRGATPFQNDDARVSGSGDEQRPSRRGETRG